MTSMRSKIVSGFLGFVVAISAISIDAGPAMAGVSSSGGGGHVSSSGGGSSGGGRAVQAPSNSGGGRAVQAPSNSGGGSSNKAPSNSGGGSSNKAPSGGRNVNAPSNSNGKAVPLTSSQVVKNPPTTRVSIPPTARASGSSYSYGGTTWNYSRASYHSYYMTYHGGYPTYGSVEYWSLYNSPWYAPNYALYGNSWYHKPYPLGYVLSSGEFVPVANQAPVVHHSSHVLLFVLIGLAVLLLVGVGVFVYMRKPKASTYGRDI